MDDYILRDAAKVKIWKCPETILATQEAEDYLIEQIDSIPAANVRPVVLCRDCEHAPEPDESDYGLNVRFPDDACPFNRPDHWYNVRPAPEFFCANGERRKGGTP